ncbi:MAG: CoA transferase [Streptosporangiales bacterium]|nr:CoA transferase [Streptosporangiales bacterium]
MTAFEGVTVLELGHVYNGPYCGLLLAHLGADVIKVEPPGGERLRYRSTHQETHEFLMINSNKRSIVVDIKNDAGRQVFLDLAAKADVIIENFAPGTMDRLGLGPDSLLERNPGLVYATGKGYGTEGPYAHMAAMDITVQAMSGTIASTGLPDGPPVKAGPAFIDFGSGAHLFGAIAAALYQREKTGRGQIVEVAMLDTVYPALASALGGLHNDPERQLPERTGNRHSGLAVVPYNVYRTADGWLAIIAQSERHFTGVCKVIGREDMLTDPRFADRYARMEHIDDVDAAVEEWTSTQGRWEAVRALQEEGVPCAPVLTVREVDTDPHLLQRGMIREVEHPERGTIRVSGSPLHLGDSPLDDVALAPTLAADTDDVLAGICAYAPEEIARLRAAGAVQ